MIAVMPDEKKLYLTNTISGTLTVLHRETGKQKVIVTGPRSEGIAMSPNGREVWVADRGDNVIRVISTASDEIVVSFPSGGMAPLRMRFTPDGSQGVDFERRRQAGERFRRACEAPAGGYISVDEGRRAWFFRPTANARISPSRMRT